MVTKLQLFLRTNIFNASRKYKPSVLQKRPLHLISVSVHRCNLRLGKQESHLWLRWPAFNFGSQTAISQCNCSHVMVTLLYRILGYDMAIQRTWVTAVSSSIAFKIAAKPLQIETWLLLTAHFNRKSPLPYSTVP